MRALNIFLLIALHISLNAQGVGSMGIKLTAGTTPNTTLDVNGSAAFREGTALTLANGVNNDVSLSTNSFFRITSPTAAFNISGFANGQDGRMLYIVNTTIYNMTLNNSSTSSLAANRIQTGTGADLLIGGGGTATLIYNATTALWTVVGTSGAVLSSSGGIGSISYVIKSADESISNSTTIQNDDHLLFTIGANETWFLETMIFVDGTAGYIKYGIDIPSGTLKVDTQQWAGTGPGTTPHEIITADNTATSLTTFNVDGTNGRTMATMRGLIIAGGTGGTVYIKWAQGSSNASATTVRTNSYLRATRLQ